MAGIRTTLHKIIRNLAQLSLTYRWITLGLALIASVPAFALGLGDLTVSSSLGQALDARISLLGTPKDLNLDCFKVAPTNGDSMALPSDIRLKLEQSRESASLRIQTRQIINEPAMMFSVSSVCPERIQRDYAVLLDPPALPAAVPVVASNSGTAAANGSLPPAPARTATKSGRRKAAASTSASTRGNQAASRHTPKRTIGSISEEPRLILSGSRRTYSPESAQLALNMDVSVLDMNRKAEVPLTPAELTDENTALSRKVIHLEQLLAGLQKRNAELEQARAKNHTGLKQTATPRKSSDGHGWPYFMLGFALLSGGAAYALYRRRHVPVERFRDTETLSVPASPLSMHPAEEEIEQPTIIKVPRTEQPSTPDIPPSPLAARSNEGTEVKDSVADEVEVFVAHGHSDLAIHMLEDHVEKTPDESPVPWLLLLDLLKRESAESKYENYRQKVKLHFNVAMPAYSEVEVNLAGHGLESYSHIMSELVRLWPTDQVNAYLDDLIYDRRGGSRMGFDPATYRDIVLLRALRTGSAWKSLV